MSSPTQTPRVAVLGAGITGLTTAWHLQRAGFAPTVFEKSPRVGGAIGTTTSDGWLTELGPNSLLETSSVVASLVDQLGLSDRRCYATAAAKKRYIVRNGRLVAMPMSPVGFVGTKLFSWRAKLGVMGEPWRRRGGVDHEESVADFVVRRLGREFLDYAINPFVGGVYAGDPARLSVRHAFPKLYALEQEHGSLIRGALKRRNSSGGPKGRIFSFKNGLGELPHALAHSLGDAVHLRAGVKAVRRTAHGWEIACESGGFLQTGEFVAVVCALPADALAALGIEGVPEACRLAMLREIDHPPVASVFTGYRRDQVQHPLDGFGMLVPQVECRSILGTLFSSTMFPDRAPQGHVGLTSFVGGARQPELVGSDESKLVQIVQAELSKLVGVRGVPAFTRVKIWPRAIPQYALGYQRYNDAINAVESSAPGLFVGGNCRDGISLTNCIESGQRLATSVTTFIHADGGRPSLAGP